MNQTSSASGKMDGGGCSAAPASESMVPATVATLSSSISIEDCQRRAATSTGGPAVVLTADRTLFAEYPTLLDGMSAASQTTWLPSRLIHGWIAPRVRCGAGGAALRAPLGLRRLEAALLRHGFERHEVAVVPPEALERVVTGRTRIIGVSTGDPLGVGMNSTTVAALFGGAPITSHCWRGLMERIERLRDRMGLKSRLILGGPGAWQFGDDAARLKAAGVDHLVTGYAEGSFPELVESIVSGDEAPAIIRGRGLPATELPAVVGPTVMGMVEVSRGCGWGCNFCTLAGQAMSHLPAETVLADVEANVFGGVVNVALGSEDFFRYGGTGGETSAGAIIDLLRRVRTVEGLRTVSIDHANISSVAATDDAALGEICRLLRGGGSGGGGGRYSARPWVNLGVETASGRLLQAHGGVRKMQPFGPQGWAEGCERQIRRLVDHGYFPLVSLVIGLEGETADEVAATSRLVERVSQLPLAVVPLLLAPLEGAGGGVRLRADQWSLLGQGMELALRNMPRLYLEHHRAAGVNVFRRLALQAMGRGYAWMWRRRHGRCVRSAGDR